MMQYNYKQIRKAVIQWIKDVNKDKKFNIELIKDKKNCLIYDIDFKFTLANIVVSDGEFAPYCHVGFEAVALEDDFAKLVYFFYDSENMNLSETICELDNAFVYCYNYKPGYLKKTYVNSYGKIDLNKLSKFTVHPDDCDKDINITSGKSYKCIGVVAQYLIVDIDGTKIRILSDIFI